jgi:hypothetical protein
LPADDALRLLDLHQRLCVVRVRQQLHDVRPVQETRQHGLRHTRHKETHTQTRTERKCQYQCLCYALGAP